MRDGVGGEWGKKIEHEVWVDHWRHFWREREDKAKELKARDEHLLY